MVELTNTEKQVKIVRVRDGVRTSEAKKLFVVVYNEITFIDGVEIKREEKEYFKDYDLWKSSKSGKDLIAEIDLDLAQEDPNTPRV
jgi:hypothetical protein